MDLLVCPQGKRVFYASFPNKRYRNDVASLKYFNLYVSSHMKFYYYDSST